MHVVFFFLILIFFVPFSCQRIHDCVCTYLFISLVVILFSEGEMALGN